MCLEMSIGQANRHNYMEYHKSAMDMCGDTSVHVLLHQVNRPLQ